MLKSSFNLPNLELRGGIGIARRLPWILGLTLLSISSLPVARSDSGSTVRGGGLFVRVNGKFYLLDSRKEGQCRREGMDEAISRYPEVFEKLSARHWYIASVVARETPRLEICWTSLLYELPEPTRSDSYIAPVTFRTYQVGIRDGAEVYIFEELFDQAATDAVRSQTLLHEILHSFKYNGQDPNDPSGARKLREATQAITQFARGQIGMKALKRQLDGARFQLPAELAPLDPYRAQITTLLDIESSNEDRARAFARMGFEPLAHLWQNDRVEIQKWLAFYTPSLIQLLDLPAHALQSQLRALNWDPRFQFIADADSRLSLLEYAISHHNVEATDAMLDYLQQQSGNTGQDLLKPIVKDLFVRAARGQLNFSYILNAAKYGADVNQSLDQNGSTVFHLAAYHNATDRLQVLAQLVSDYPVADPNRLNQNGYSPIVIAVQRGHTEYAVGLNAFASVDPVRSLRGLRTEEATLFMISLARTYGNDEAGLRTMEYLLAHQPGMTSSSILAAAQAALYADNSNLHFRLTTEVNRRSLP